MHIILSSSFFLLFTINVFSQSSKFHDYIVWEKGDTAYCNITSLERASGNIWAIDYINSDNQKVELRNNFEVSKAKFISVNNEFYWEYVPLKAKKPALHRHLEIEVNGKIKIYINKQLVLKTNQNGEKLIADPTAEFGGMSRTIRLDNGKYLDINPESIKKEIAPYLLSCLEFKEAFGKKITKKNIVEAVKVYNERCK